jgi:hypothetical protein
VRELPAAHPEVRHLDIAESDDAKRPTELLGGGLMESAAKATTKGAIDGVAEGLGLRGVAGH